ncbi:14334_t:CDS:2 [Cetraspora pellucida]|uniref:14334_t:CDS:1 n=1 Tax=Cetraspora pellucida TaxID=1433469 RepID=A0A9N9GGF5_9GLOM|nr:14334_t:CDS:2 [Cetraspora pellucida]
MILSISPYEEPNKSNYEQASICTDKTELYLLIKSVKESSKHHKRLSNSQFKSIEADT